MDQLEKGKEREISKLEGFGEESEKDILHQLGKQKDVLRGISSLCCADCLRNMDWMIKDKNVVRVDPLGSLRRKACTVGDIDLAVQQKSQEVLEHFSKYPKSQRTIEKGELHLR